jgi:hypothetical protein
MADTIDNLAHMLREQNHTITQLQSTVASLQSELMSQKGRNLKEEELSRMKISELQQKLTEVDRWSNVVRDLEDIPGVRTPRWYEVDVQFERGDSQLRFNSAEISPDGPFIITQMQPYYTYTEDTTDKSIFENIVGVDAAAAGIAIAGRTVPCSAFPFLLGSLGSVNNAGVGPAATPFESALIGNIAGSAQAPSDPTPLAAIPEFSFQIEIAGSGRFWTNRALPAASFYGETNPLYSGIAGWVERTDRIVVHCTPETTVPVGGRVRMVFHGYQILGHVNIGQALGY